VSRRIALSIVVVAAVLLAGAEWAVNRTGSTQDPVVPEAPPEVTDDSQGLPGAWRMADNLADLSVRVEREGRTLRLKRRHAAFHSRLLPAWNWVGPIPASLKDTPSLQGWPFVRPARPDRVETACLWVHPVDGARLVLSFGTAPAAGELDLLLAYLKTAASDASTTIRVRRDGVELHREVFVGGGGDSRRIRVPLALPEGKAQPGRPAPLELVVEPGKRGKNHLCLDGLVEPAGKAGEVGP